MIHQSLYSKSSFRRYGSWRASHFSWRMNFGFELATYTLRTSSGNVEGRLYLSGSEFVGPDYIFISKEVQLGRVF